MGRFDDYGWVAEKKQAAMAEKLARRGMPGYVQRPVSERYGTSYTGVGADGRVDRSAPAGFDMTTDPPHIYHEGEVRVSTPEGKVYLNADIAPTADPGAISEYEDAQGFSEMELAGGLGPRKDAKKRFKQTKSPSETSAQSGGLLSFRSGGGIVAGQRIPRAALEGMERSGAFRRFAGGGASMYGNPGAVPTTPTAPASKPENKASSFNPAVTPTTPIVPAPKTENKMTPGNPGAVPVLTTPPVPASKPEKKATPWWNSGAQLLAGQKSMNTLNTLKPTEAQSNPYAAGANAVIPIQRDAPPDPPTYTAQTKEQFDDAMAPGGYGEFLGSDYYNSLDDAGKKEAEAEWRERHPGRDTQKYEELAGAPLDSGMFTQNPYTQKRIDDMRQEGASRQAYLQHQQAMRGTDANAAWSQSMMQQAATEEGINDFAAQASAQDWERMQGLAREWLNSDDPALVAQAARIYNYMMPGSGIDFAGQITAASSRQFASMYEMASALSADMTEEQLISWMDSKYGDTFDRSMYPAIARGIKRTQADRMKDEYFNSDFWKEFEKNNPERAEELRWGIHEIFDGADYDGDGKLGNKATGQTDVPGSAAGSGEKAYTSGADSLKEGKALELANMDPAKMTDEQRESRQELINDIVSGKKLTPAEVVNNYKNTKLWESIVEAKVPSAEQREKIQKVSSDNKGIPIPNNILEVGFAIGETALDGGKMGTALTGAFSQMTNQINKIKSGEEPLVFQSDGKRYVFTGTRKSGDGNDNPVIVTRNVEYPFDEKVVTFDKGDGHRYK